ATLVAMNPSTQLIACMAAALLLAGCQSVSLEEPARLDAPSGACLTQLTTFASNAMSRPVTLNQQVLSDSDTMRFELPATGSTAARTEVFKLKREPGICRVVHQNTGRQTELPGCSCRGI
ncbi:MAG: hypothetical protein ACRCV9_11085, partial [Burkholderiaceae bacterium]